MPHLRYSRAAQAPEVGRRRLRLPRPGRPARPGRLAGGAAAKARSSSPLAPKAPHFNVAKAKRIIFLFMQGAMSQMDTFEYKPQLQKDDGKAGPGGGTLTASKFKFQPARPDAAPGSPSCCPNIAQHADKLCFLRGLHTDTPAHPQAVVQLHTGTALASLTRPSHGRLAALRPGHREPGPARLRHHQPAAELRRRGQLRQRLPAGPLPGHAHQRHRLSCRTCKPTAALALQRKQLDLIQAMNRDLAATPRRPTQVDGVIESYELAFQMQGKVPELLDISKEPQKVLDAYGVKPGPAGAFARQCLMARRLSEAGVRFVEICQPGWDHHNNLHKGLIDNCASVDQPTAALLADLEQRGLLDETLVLFGSEFGRHADGAGTGRPRPQHHRLSDVAGRRRREEGLLATARPTSTASTPSKAACTPTTCTPRCWR